MSFLTAGVCHNSVEGVCEAHFELLSGVAINDNARSKDPWLICYKQEVGDMHAGLLFRRQWVSTVNIL